MVDGGAVGLQWTAAAVAAAATSLQQSFQVESITSQSAVSMSIDRNMGTFCDDASPNLVAKIPEEAAKGGQDVDEKAKLAMRFG